MSEARTLGVDGEVVRIEGYGFGVVRCDQTPDPAGPHFGFVEDAAVESPEDWGALHVDSRVGRRARRDPGDGEVAHVDTLAWED